MATVDTERVIGGYRDRPLTPDEVAEIREASRTAIEKRTRILEAGLIEVRDQIRTTIRLCHGTPEAKKWQRVLDVVTRTLLA